MDPIGASVQPPVQPVAKGREKEVAQNFAAVFLTEMVDQMMKTVKTGDLDGGKAEDTWRSFLSQAMAEQIAKSGTTGVAQSVERMLSAYNQQVTAGGNADGEG